MQLDSVPRISLTQLPTPLDDAPRLAKKLGCRKIYIKRDDCTTLATGGNKVRKLEFLIADALQKKSDVVLTDGGPQSNHARLTAAACAKAGIKDCVLILGGPRFDRFQGNLLLDIALGANIKFLEDATVRDMEDQMQVEAKKLRSAGRAPYIIPIGGSNPLGALGYVDCMRELADQLGPEDKAPLIFVAVGSAGTLAGCALGVRTFLPDAELVGISVARKAKPLCEEAAKNASGASELLGIDETFTPDDIKVIDDYYGRMYGEPTEGGNNAILMLARNEGIILDPVYTGKAMSGVIDLAQSSKIDTDRTIVFIHTGGAASLFAFEDCFRNKAKYTIGEKRQQSE